MRVWDRPRVRLIPARVKTYCRPGVSMKILKTYSFLSLVKVRFCASQVGPPCRARNGVRRKHERQQCI